MRVRRLQISNYRGIAQGCVDFIGHTLLVGGNNCGKSTICEALDLVLGPERLFRRPMIDEHDFHCGRYLDQAGNAVEIRIEAVLLDLPEEARRRFAAHLRRWDDETGLFVDVGANPLDRADGPDVKWALPLLFVGRYDREEDDFIGNTFFDHPAAQIDTLDEETQLKLGQGRTPFTRGHKRLCGFVFLRALRTGSRALSLQRGSLLDTVLKLSSAGSVDMWEDTLARLQGLDPAIGEVGQLKQIRDELRRRMSRFLNLAPDDDSTAFFASDLTREHLREVVRLFIAVQPGKHLVPFSRLSTGSINLLVFALLTTIAELKDTQSVIFAMEEPEIALPPHTQRRITRYVLGKMGQSIVTSHSPYVIEQFDPAQILILNRDDFGVLVGRAIDGEAIKAKSFKTQRRQFAEAILSRAVLVVEGSTEASIFPVASSIMEANLGADSYTHLDLAGVSIFDAGGEGAVARHGSVFSALGKLSFALYDKPNSPLAEGAKERIKCYTEVWESPEKGIEKVLVEQTPTSVIRLFLSEVQGRSDYPKQEGGYDPAGSDAEVAELALKVLKARKGDAYGYAALLIAQCQAVDELPITVRRVLETINQALNTESEDVPEEAVDSLEVLMS